MVVVVQILLLLLRVYELILLVRVLMSWFQPDPYNPIVRLLYNLTEPVLKPIRDMLPRTGMMDLSPLVAFLLLFALRSIIIRLL